MARKLTLEQINHQITKLQDQAAKIADAEKAEVIGKMKVAIDHYGITAADLGLSKSGKSKARKADGKAKPKAKALGRVKYKDDAGNSWTGVGRRPAWFVEALASGKTEADLRA
jgi:DNA-binding protein H-NS